MKFRRSSHTFLRSFFSSFLKSAGKSILSRVLNDTAHVISTGGGSILSPKTRSLIKSKSCSIWVQCDVRIILKRITNNETRPLLKNRNVLDTLIEKNEERIKFYSQADIHIKNENPNLELTVDAIVKSLLFNKVIENND